MARRTTGRGGYWWAGAGWGVAGGVALGALVLAPHMFGHDSPVEEETVTQAEYEVARQDADIASAQAVVADEAVAKLLDPVLQDSLTERPVLVLSTANAAQEDVDAVRWLLGQAGAHDAGHIGLTDKFVEQDAADELGSIIANTLPAGAQLSTDNFAPGVHAGESLGAGLMLDPETAEPVATPEDRALVLESLRDAGFVTYTEGTILPAQVIVVITGGNDGTGEGAFAAETTANLAVALDSRGVGTVLAGRIESAAEAGPIGRLRTDPDATHGVTTIDSVDKEFGRGGVILGVAEQLADQAGAYGAALEATEALPPVAFATD